MLAIDFYESGQGETIILTFPGGGIGVVDAHPSSSNGRPQIEDLVRNKNVHFLCLTHPHEDHGLDLCAALKAAAKVESFWHTLSDVQAFAYAVSQQTVFPSAQNPLLGLFRKEWAEFLIDLYAEVGSRDDAEPGFIRRIHSDRQPQTIDGVTIHFLGPTEREQNRFTAIYRARLQGKHRNKPNENSLSAILAIDFAGNLVVLGADALTGNWLLAVERLKRLALPAVSILKVPHHGARNAAGGKTRGYFSLCRKAPRTNSVLFAGDLKHPEDRVFDQLKTTTKLTCLANGYKSRSTSGPHNPLGIALPGAKALGSSHVCNSQIRFEIRQDGVLSQTVGKQCSFCVGS